MIILRRKIWKYAEKVVSLQSILKRQISRKFSKADKGFL